MYIAGQWASLGSTSIDLSAYYTKNDIDTLLLGYVTTSSLTTIFADYVKKTDLASVATSGSYNDLNDLPTIPTIEGLATKKYVDDEIKNASVDLTGYATEQYVDDAISNIPSGDGESVDLSDYYKKSETYNKTEVDNLISSTDIDTTMSDTSENPVQNKVIKKYVDEKSIDVSTENDNALQEKTDGLYVKDLTGEFDKFNIAQKTVNEVGSVSLLKNPISFQVAGATKIGTAVKTELNMDIILTEDISSYDNIEFLLRIASSSKNRQPQTTRFRVKNINYNNSNTQNENNGSVITIAYNIATDSANAHGQFQSSIVGWFKNTTTFRLARFQNSVQDAGSQTWEITDIIGIKDRSIIIDPLEYVNTENGIEDTPIGHVIAHMGNTAPKHYLICDGTEYNITDYPYLVQHFKDEFGSTNYFGGNGTTTFAVPDLRGEFLRGAGDNSRADQGAGAKVGTHQDATKHIGMNFGVGDPSNDDHIFFVKRGNYVDYIMDNLNIDSDTGRGKAVYNIAPTNRRAGTDNVPEYFTSRPTNTSVQYCIKYEPTYFMKIEGKDNYSTDERMIGYWIDGKPLYKKTIPMEITDVTGVTINKDIKQLNIDNIISITGNAKSSKNVTVCIPYSDPTNNNKVKVIFNDGVLQLDVIGSTTYIGSTAYVTIEYTKTTD